MPKSKQLKTSTGTIGPAPIAPNPFAGLSPETRWLMLRQIDDQIAALERTAQELISVKRMISQVPATSEPLAQDPPEPANAPARKRGRPPGSKNKPKSAEPAAPADPANPSQPTQENMFSEAVDATRPERDKEFQAA